METIATHCHDACYAHGHGEQAAPTAHAALAHAGPGKGGCPASLATAATIHCLTGCVIGEVAGLAIGVSLDLPIWATIALAAGLAYLSGFALGLRPLIRQGMSPLQALRTIWLGEAISIAVMEIAMNFADYHVGGMAAASVLEPMFWLGIAVVVPAGFIAAWPVNW